MPKQFRKEVCLLWNAVKFHWEGRVRPSVGFRIQILPGISLKDKPHTHTKKTNT